MRYNDYEPIYLQIINDIKAQIAFGHLKPGMQLPTIKEQAVIMKVNPNTIARVYYLLEQEDIINKQKGIGTFVSKNEHLARNLRDTAAKIITSRFVSEMARLGFSTTGIATRLDLYLKNEYGNSSTF